MTDPVLIPRRRFTLALALCAGADAAVAAPDAPALQFRGTRFVHRWSRNDQHEFTPEADADLQTWRDMITLNVHAAATDGDRLATVANQVLGNYQRRGKVLRTASVPRRADRPAEHLIAAVLATPQSLEAAFARCLMHDGAGLVAVVSHRIHGAAVGPEMSQWLRDNGQAVEQAWMAWGPAPARDLLQRLPQTR